MRLGVALVLGTLLVGSPVVAHAAPDPPVPGADQVAAARQQVRSATERLGAVRARLAEADSRVRRLEIAAEQAVEAYDTAVYQLAKANRTAKVTKGRATVARRATEKQRRVVASFAAASYRLDPRFAEMSAYLAANGPQGMLDRAATVSMVDASVSHAYQSLRASRSATAVLDAQADKALATQRRRTTEARAAKEKAKAAVTAQATVVVSIQRDKRRLQGSLTTLERRSTQLAADRRRGLEERARRDRSHRDGGGGVPTGPGPSERQRDVAVSFALAQLGEPYVFGADGPDTWDCSGLTMRAWQEAGISMPHFARGQYWQSTHISEAQLRRGDLIFWASDPSDSNAIYHVAMYIGGGQMVQAPRPGRGVERRSVGYMGAPAFFARPA
ncbi:MAG TPA: C40 family peptidase [Actinopolymorphaceae bacterium]|nr:C40 family peptidase [Actinopolymorphaceae bacterium]